MGIAAFFIDLLGRYQLWRFSRHNVLEGRPARISGLIKLESTGGNRLAIGEGTEISDMVVRFGSAGTVLALGGDCIIRGRFMINGGGEIVIGARTRFNKPCWMSVSPGKAIRIGDDCLFSNVRVRTSDIHKIIDRKTRKRVNLPADVIVADRVWIAESATIYKGVTIGANAVVGAHSVVTRDVPAGTVVAGVPARVVREGIIWKR